MKTNTIHPPQLREVPGALGHDTYKKRVDAHVTKNAKAVEEEAKKETDETAESQQSGRSTLAMLLLIAMLFMGVLGVRAATTYWLTNYMAVPVNAILFSNGPAGYTWFYPPTLINGGTSNQLTSGTGAANGVAIFGTNANSALYLAPTNYFGAGSGTNVLAIITNSYTTLAVPQSWLTDTNAP